jgi:hypothetical protein
MGQGHGREWAMRSFLRKWQDELEETFTGKVDAPPAGRCGWKTGMTLASTWIFTVT